MTTHIFRPAPTLHIQKAGDAECEPYFNKLPAGFLLLDDMGVTPISERHPHPYVCGLCRERTLVPCACRSRP